MQKDFLKSLKMKKRILSGLFALALLATAGFGVQKSVKSEASLSDLALANVEALAQNEDGNNSKGSPTSKTVTKFFYDSEGKLIRTEEHVEPCCIPGSLNCYAPPC
jgi:hypothetical protein